MENLREEELENFLQENGCSETMINAVRENNLRGSDLLLLTEAEVKELAPKLGDRAKLRELIKKHKVKLQGKKMHEITQFTIIYIEG